jgi:hypothetical protein
MVSYRIPVTRDEDVKLRQLAQLLGYESPSAYLRCIAQREVAARPDPVHTVGAAVVAVPEAIDPTQEQAVIGTEIDRLRAALQESLSHGVACISDVLVQHQATVRTAVEQGVLANTKTLVRIDAIARAALRQSTAAAYMTVVLWRMLSDRAAVPPAGLPTHMLDEINRLHGRILGEIDREART